MPRYQPQIGISISQDWWWKERLGKANYQLGLFREAEKWFRASLFDEGSDLERQFTQRKNPKQRTFSAKLGVVKRDKKKGGGEEEGGSNSASKTAAGDEVSSFMHYHASTLMELCKVYLKMDQPLTAMDMYRRAIRANPTDPCITLCLARLHDELHNPVEAFHCFATVLEMDSSNVEAVACVAAFFFYEKNQPELALRFYRRLLQTGVQRAEVWNNIALSAHQTSQFDFALSCFERSLLLCENDETRADVWYNIAHVGISLGDLAFAERALRISLALDPTHGEAQNNLAVLALHKSRRFVEHKGGKAFVHPDEDIHRARAKETLKETLAVAPLLEEGLYNSALVAYEDGELEQAHELLLRLLEAHPEHPEGLALANRMKGDLDFSS